MLRNKLLTICTAVAVLLSINVNAQNNRKVSDVFQNSRYEQLSTNPNHRIKATKYLAVSLDYDRLNTALMSIPTVNVNPILGDLYLSLPHPDGTTHQYVVHRNTTMHPELQQNFPEIATFDAIGVSHKSERAKIDITPHGFHAMIFVPGASTVFIDPIEMGNTEDYMVYYKKDFVTDKQMTCEVQTALSEFDEGADIRASFASCELRTYRLALAATGEYTQFHGGTVALALAAQVTTMNRVNGVYERDMAITMTIIANNNLIVYTNGATDPYTNGNAGTMIGQNQTNCTNVIGAANYDIGHVFGTNSGGLAGLGVVCSNTNKARGVTGSNAPVGDPFDIDYVAHEMGHQFAANHTQNNNCNSVSATRMEPGSASTIMGYAGICAPNVQSNSDDYFHGVSMREMGLFVSGGGHTCPVKTPLSNAAPVINSTNANVTVPISTPFALTANATDADGDELTYLWEQMNNQASTQPPVATAAGGPNFRSFDPSLSPTRYFPNLTALSAGGPFTWEVLPSVSRTMNFRVSVHDNHSVASCNDYMDVTVTTDATAGPFVLNYPSATGITWAATSNQTVLWNVANTNNASVNCQFVDLYLSTDGGQTYPTLLASNVANNGSYEILVPNTPTTTARVMAISDAGTFFDISNNNFEITGVSDTYELIVVNDVIGVCSEDDAIYEIEILQIGSYTDPVNFSVTGLPGGATSSFSVNPTSTPGLSSLTIGTVGVTPGDYTFNLESSSTSGNQSIVLTLNIGTGAPGPVSPISPAGGEDNVGIPTTFTWSASATPGALYDIQISDDPLMVAFVDEGNNLASTTFVSNLLLPGTVYYWRVRSVNGCGNADFSSSNSFTTANCSTHDATDIPIAISASGTPTITSTINVPVNGTINHVSVLNLVGNHTWVSDLTVSLTSPEGTTVVLFDGICGNNDDFDLNFDDDAAAGAIPCPPTTGLTYQPVGSLASFVGEEASGDWVLTISDNANQDGGALEGWSLQICIDELPCTYPTTPIYSGITSVCLGDETTLYVDFGDLNDAVDWYWYTGSCGGTLLGTGTDVTFSPTETMYVYLRGFGNCVVTGACQLIEIFVDEIDNTVTQSGMTLTATQTGASYQWLDCNDGNSPIAGATSQSYTSTAIVGSYAVQIDYLTCTETSDCVVIDVTSIDELENGASIELYPNPTNGVVFINWSGVDLTKIRLTDAAGRLISFDEVTNTKSHEVSLNHLSDGMYFIHCESSASNKVFKVIKE